MAVEIIWDKERQRGIKLKMNSAILGIYIAMAAYIISGLSHISKDGLHKEKLILISVLIAVLYLGSKFEKIAKDRRDSVSCILKGVFCGTTFAITYWYLYMDSGAPGVGIFIGIFVGMTRSMAAKYGNQVKDQKNNT